MIFKYNGKNVLPLLRRKYLTIHFTPNVPTPPTPYLTGYDVVGSPEISGNILRTSTGNFIKTPFVFSPQNKDWEIQMKIKLPSTYATSDNNFYGLIYSVDSDNTFQYAVAVGIKPKWSTSYHWRNFVLQLSTDGTHYSTDHLSNLDTPPTIDKFIGKDCYLKIGCQYGTSQYPFRYYLAASLDGVTWDEADKKTFNNTGRIFGDTYISFGNAGVSFNGDIYLDSLKIYIDNSLYWQAVE